jgi:hypothetical protein
MRPIIKQTPIDLDTKLPISFSEYKQAKPYLIDQLGEYCSFCERQLDEDILAVEHIFHKDFYICLEKDWVNFLLSCGMCNSIKGTKNFAEILSFLPQIHNLLSYIDINDGFFVSVKPNLSSVETEKTIAFIKMVGLDRMYGHPQHTKGDKRYIKRSETYKKAKHKLLQYSEMSNKNKSAFLEIIIELAKATGFFSIWFIVFEAYPEVRQALIEAFEGTDNTCFDAANRYEPLPRFLDDSGLLLAQ